MLLKSMKKSLLWIVVLVLSISMVAAFSLAGCKAAAEEAVEEEAVEEAAPVEEAPAEEAAAETTAAPVSFEGVQLKVAMIDEPRERLFKELLPEFKKLTGIDVTIDFYGFDDLYNKNITSSAAHTGEYDVYQIHFPDIALFDERGFMVDVTDWVERDWAEMEMDDIQTSLQESHMKYKDRYYGVPTHVGSHEFYYRTDIFEKEGYTLPKTYDDVLTLAKEIDAKYAPTTRGFVFMGRADVQGCSTFMGFLGSYGGDFFDNYTHQRPAMDSPAALKAMNTLKEIYKYSVEGSNVYSFDEGQTAFKQGKAAMISFWDSGDNFFGDPEQSDIIGKWAIAPYPGGRTPNGGWSVQISADSKNAAAAWEFLKWIISPDVEKKAVPLTPSCRTSILIDPQNSKYPSYAAFNDVLKGNPIGFPKVLPNWQIINETGAMVSSVTTGQVTPEEGLATLQKSMESIMLRYGLWDGKK